MKKRYIWLLLSCLMFLTIFCSSCEKTEEEAELLPECEALETIRATDEKEVVSITYAWYTEGGPVEKTIVDEIERNEVYARIGAIEVGEKSRQSVTDYGLWIGVEYKDQSSVGIRFEGDNILINETEYVAKNIRELRSYLQERDREEEYQKELEELE